jgi:hypothetical protein
MVDPTARVTTHPGTVYITLVILYIKYTGRRDDEFTDGG